MVKKREKVEGKYQAADAVQLHSQGHKPLMAMGGGVNSQGPPRYGKQMCVHDRYHLAQAEVQSKNQREKLFGDMS